jgi:hypothetical protein
MVGRYPFVMRLSGRAEVVSNFPMNVDWFCALVLPAPWPVTRPRPTAQGPPPRCPIMKAAHRPGSPGICWCAARSLATPRASTSSRSASRPPVSCHTRRLGPAAPPHGPSPAGADATSSAPEPATTSEDKPNRTKSCWGCWSAQPICLGSCSLFRILSALRWGLPCQLIVGALHLAL